MASNQFGPLDDLLNSVRAGALSRRAFVKRSAALGVSATFAGGLLDACGGSSQPATGSSGKVTLDFWTWVPGIDKPINAFNATHPDIHINLVTTPTGGNGMYTKLLTAIKAGNPPDLAQVEFNVLPQFETTGGLLDLAPYGAGSHKSKFLPWAWNQCVQGSSIYAIPQGGGPMGLYYRKDIFSKYNVPVPTTWDEFATAAAQLHKADPTVYIADFPPKNLGWFNALCWQAGANWFGAQGQSWTVSINGLESKMVADYWQKLIDQRLVKTEADFTTAFYQDLASGTVATWPGAQWCNTIIESEAPKASGKWGIAPMPEWQAGKPMNANWGGSTTAALKATKYPQQATTFALWLNESLQSWQAGMYVGAGWPVAYDALNISQLQQPDPYFNNQNPNTVFATGNSQINENWVWGPTMLQVTNDGGDAIAAAVAGQGTISSALDQLQAKTVAEMQQQGFTVAS